jgi:hypothetical protein
VKKLREQQMGGAMSRSAETRDGRLELRTKEEKRLLAATACSMDVPRFVATLDAKIPASRESSIAVLIGAFSPHLKAKSRARGHSGETIHSPFF